MDDAPGQAFEDERDGATDGGFRPEELDRMVITPPLLYDLRIPGSDAQLFYVIIDLNLDYPGGRLDARRTVLALIDAVRAESADKGLGEGVIQHDAVQGDPTHPYVFAQLSGATIKAIVAQDRDTLPQARITASGQIPSARGAIYRVWEDAEVHPLITRSIATVKADAAQIAYSALGTDIVWAVLDSGIEREHVHFTTFKNLEPPKPIEHKDFTGGGAPLSDPFGHGTHVAGIIAGAFMAGANDPPRLAISRFRNESGDTLTRTTEIRKISSMAPRCALVSLRVLDDRGHGRVSMIIDALEEVQRLNDFGRRLLVHGVNLSVGYDFDPKWFACGQSPLCVEVDRLVRSGVVVVVAAGNTGYGWTATQQRGNVTAGLALSINDPGNAELAITVGSTHRDMPFTYGVSYFSSKGPTGDGRCKPDLVAPGERIISCAAGQKRTAGSAPAPPNPPPVAAQALPAQAMPAGQPASPPAPAPPSIDYVEDSGTSMAAPHVSGIVAAFLSIRREFIGQPESLKAILLSTATDLKRDRSFQGAGLVDLMRAIQSV
ncbi:MAG: S8 family peptidase [Vulcanimicrobiaceae bacterium]